MLKNLYKLFRRFCGLTYFLKKTMQFRCLRFYWTFVVSLLMLPSVQRTGGARAKKSTSKYQYQNYFENICTFKRYFAKQRKNGICNSYVMYLHHDIDKT